jgi:hypothetical protein
MVYDSNHLYAECDWKNFGGESMGAYERAFEKLFKIPCGGNYRYKHLVFVRKYNNQLETTFVGGNSDLRRE